MTSSDANFVVSIDWANGSRSIAKEETMSNPIAILIVYSSHDGQTELIARRLGESARAAGALVDVCKVSNCAGALVGRYDGVIIAASIRFGKHSRAIRRFVRDHVARSSHRSAFVSVSGSSASASGTSEARRYVAEFLAGTGWSPDATLLAAGAIKFTRYNPLLRMVMKRIAIKGGLPADTHRDYEYTDWRAVERFAADFVRRAEPAPRRFESATRMSEAVAETAS
jgi:menaquinone-dependent protoporphyrinogen oxidase